MSAAITPQETLDLLASTTHTHAFLDVRSEQEFADAYVRGFLNVPILNNQERHLVGTCYKQQGSQAAFALGHELTAPFRRERVQRWIECAADRHLIVCCWRGGARSRFACEWLAEAGVATLRVSGGYKALRQLLRQRLEQPPILRVLAGPTGVGKTDLLRQLPVPKVDLEACANHRGSAFGECGAQPTQQQFENDVALALWPNHPHFWLEDESRLIGKLEIPATLKAAMYASPVVMLDADIETRARHIYKEYVAQPLQQLVTPAALKQQLIGSVLRIQKKLGDQRCRDIVSEIERAFAVDASALSSHQRWIQSLLQWYYDPRYEHAYSQHPRTLIFRGSYAAILTAVQRGEL